MSLWSLPAIPQFYGSTNCQLYETGITRNDTPSSLSANKLQVYSNESRRLMRGEGYSLWTQGLFWGFRTQLNCLLKKELAINLSISGRNKKE